MFFSKHPQTAILTLQVVLLGVCRSEDDESVQLQPLPHYACPTDGVTMTCIATTTVGGRILMGGADGHVYELCYAGNSRWGRNKCYKVKSRSFCT